MPFETSFSADACSFRTPGGHGITVNDVQVIFKRLRSVVQVLLTQIIAWILLEQIISRAMFSALVLNERTDAKYCTVRTLNVQCLINSTSFVVDKKRRFK